MTARAERKSENASGSGRTSTAIIEYVGTIATKSAANTPKLPQLRALTYPAAASVRVSSGSIASLR